VRIPIVAQLMRIAWHTIDQICERVVAEAQLEVDLLAGLKRIGIQPSWEGAARLVDPHSGAEEKRRHRGGPYRSRQKRQRTTPFALWGSGPRAQVSERDKSPNKPPNI